MKTVPNFKISLIAIAMLFISFFCNAGNDNGVLLVAEAERPLDFIVIGLWADSHKYISMPGIDWPSGGRKSEKKEIEKQLYWMNLEFTHGDIFKKLPAYTRIYAAVPDRRYVKEADGNEKEYFKEYLKSRCAFTDADIKKRVSFFNSSIVLVWPQDMCKVIGYDKSDGRVAVVRSAGDTPVYVKAVKELTDAFPDKFVLKEAGMLTSAEGGDEDMIRLPDKRTALMTGRHRAQRYAERKENRSFDRTPVDDDTREEARKAFSSAYFGAPVVFMPEETLKDPEKGSEEVFHLDMLAAVLPDPKGGRPKAFVPDVMNDCRVSINDEQLDRAFVSHMKAEYNCAASQFGKMGYDVVRLAFCDHPVRGPVNLIRFHDKITDKYTVMLGKYPNHLPVNDPYTPQHKIVEAFRTLQSELELWGAKTDEATYGRLTSVIGMTWELMDTVENEPNPVYEAQKKQFEKYGYSVITVPVYPWGAGGLHCMVMY